MKTETASDVDVRTLDEETRYGKQTWNTGQKSGRPLLEGSGTCRRSSTRPIDRSSSCRRMAVPTPRDRGGPIVGTSCPLVSWNSCQKPFRTSQRRRYATSVIRHNPSATSTRVGCHVTAPRLCRVTRALALDLSTITVSVERAGSDCHPDQRSTQSAACRQESHGQEREEGRPWQSTRSLRHPCRQSKGRFRSSALLPPVEGRALAWLPLMSRFQA